MKTPSKNVVFTLVQQMLAASPERSFKRLNPALRSLLGNCIEADLPFQRDTFRRIYDQLRGGWWFGDGAGSAMGEHYYTQACSLNHASAIQSFEHFADRPGVLWEENAATPERLHVGSQFHWQGHYVTVTSMRKDSLVACTYKDSKDRVEGFKVGAVLTDYSQRHDTDRSYVISASKQQGRACAIRLIPSKANTGSCDVAKRFTIPYTEIAEFRRTEAKRLKVVLAAIEASDPRDQATVKTLAERISNEHFRHFQLEKTNAAVTKRKEQLSEAERRELEQQGEAVRIEAWRGGANGAYLGVRQNLLRISGSLVQCSNGNSVSLAAVQRAIPVILDRRQKPGNLALPIDGHTVKRTDKSGVTVGCTFIAWDEVERFAKLLN